MPFEGTMNTARGAAGSGRDAARQLEAWAAEALAEMRAGAMHAPPADQWTPKAVGEAMVDSLRWVRRAAGRVGPAGMVAARLPEVFLSPEDRLALGWDAAVEPDPEDMRPAICRPTAAQISRHLDAIEWLGRYLVAEGRVGSARMVGLWAACRAYRRPFAAAVKAKGLDRSLAYRLRDRGLSLISQGLDRNGIPLNRYEAERG